MFLANANRGVSDSWNALRVRCEPGFGGCAGEAREKQIGLGVLVTDWRLFLEVQQGERAPRTHEQPSPLRVGTSMLTLCTTGNRQPKSMAFTPFVQVATYATRHFATFGLAPAAAI